MFKKPKTKNIAKVAKGLVAYQVGQRLSNGVAGLIPATVNTLYVKAGLALAAVIAAATYSGSNKDLVIPALIGVASEQGGSIVDGELAKRMNRTATDSKVKTFINDVAGLNCPCDGAAYNSLGMPSNIEAITWDDVYDENEKEYTDFENVPQAAFGGGEAI